ncbi:MAG TPA: glycoside hydrolase domain-containing protein [Gaiellaceae bacterium]
MTFGIDTFRSRLDLLTTIATGGDFFVWNGNAAPDFAGRNFLVGDFMWAHAEATNASSEPDGARYPLPAAAASPESPENLTLSVTRVAPIQAPQPAHQRLTGDRGRLYGMIDADAICRRVVAAILAGELDLSEAHLMHIWLSVDPTEPFSDDYWAGWADKVNNFVLPITANGVHLTDIQPFRAGIFCTYVDGDDGRLRPDHRVTDALKVRHRGMNTGQHGFWADFKLWDNAPHDLAANDADPRLDWDRFDPPTAPILWRFAHGIERPDGTAAAHVDCDIDGASPTAEPLAFMFATRTWQPNVPTIQNLGFIKEVAITNVQSQCLQQTPMPDMDDNNFHANSGHFHVPSGPIKFIGRYLRHGLGGGTVSSAEAQMLSNANFQLFTIWESTRPLAGMGAAGAAPTEQDTAPAPGHPCRHWGRFGAKTQKHIFYFNPDPDGNAATHDDAGTLDGTEAFQYIGDTLKQPPNTPVFFSIDFDPYDLPDASTAGAWPGPGPEPADWPHDWPTLPPVNRRENWIRSYFARIKVARDAYFDRTGRYYLIGVYAPGKTLELLYKQGLVSYFWQAGSSGRSGSRPPRWPWFHANRWQYQGNVAPICTIQQPDPDADWGDGGLWSLNDPLAVDLGQLERLGVVFPFADFGELVVPPPPPPPPP